MIKAIVLAALTAAAAALPASGAINKGEKSLGPKIGYVSHNSSVVAGLVFQYTFSEHLRISPEIGCAFRNDNQDAFLADVNFHVPFGLLDTDKVVLYPLAGLAFNSWALHGHDVAREADVTTHVNRFGVNLGAGFDLRCMSTLKLNLEAKYTLVKSYSSAYVTVGISYIF